MPESDGFRTEHSVARAAYFGIQSSLNVAAIILETLEVRELIDRSSRKEILNDIFIHAYKAAGDEPAIRAILDNLMAKQLTPLMQSSGPA